MNVTDTRKIIFSYLRKEPRIKCHGCEKVLIWEKKKREEYFARSLEKNYIAYFCKSCYYGNNVQIFQIIVFVILFFILYYIYQ